jgi:hypothetical protein
MATLFGGATPAGSQFLDGSPGIKVGLTFNFSGPGTITELWWYCGPNTGGTWTLTLWDVTTGDASLTGTGTQLKSQAFVGTPVANAWNKVSLTAAQAVLGGNKRYRLAVHNGQYYWVNNNFFNAHDEVNGPISALRDGDSSSPLGSIRQGTFIVASSATTYPSQTGSKALYPVDVTFIPDATASFFVYNGSTEVPGAVSVWNGTSEVPMNSFEIAP